MSEGREIKLIAFRIGTELFLLDIMAVRQIVVYSGSRPVPRAPSFIEGITVLREEVIPIIDLRSRLFPHLPPPEEQPFVLITRSDEGALGLKVDEVRRIMRLDVDSILPPPPIIRGLEGEMFVGVVHLDRDLYLVMDLEAVLTADERRSLAKADLTAETADQKAESRKQKEDGGNEKAGSRKKNAEVTE